MISTEAMSGPRSTARRTGAWRPLDQRIRAGSSSTWSTAGALAAGQWLRSVGVATPATVRWHVEVAFGVLDEPAPVEFDDATASRFHLDIYSEEWGVFFCHGGRSSWIRVTDIAFVHGRDDHALLGVTPSLRAIGSLLRRLEHQYALAFRREHALVRTNLAGAEPAIRAWIASL